LADGLRSACSRTLRLALRATDRESLKFRTFYHGYNHRHLNTKRTFHATRTMPDGTIQPPLAAPPDEQRGMTWEDQYDYGSDGQFDGGGTGGFLP
jgi:hypothetical protein